MTDIQIMAQPMQTQCTTNPLMIYMYIHLQVWYGCQSNFS